jgi:hypothetical protein
MQYLCFWKVLLKLLRYASVEFYQFLFRHGSGVNEQIDRRKMGVYETEQRKVVAVKYTLTTAAPI